MLVHWDLINFFLHTFRLDKTQVFNDQIEAKQRDLEPWTVKINGKEAEINVAMSERMALSKKAEELQTTSRQASETLDQLRAEQQSKVSASEQIADDCLLTLPLGPGAWKPAY